jgi:hypothetical protein
MTRLVDLVDHYQLSTNQLRTLYDRTRAAAADQVVPPRITAALAAARPVLEHAELLQTQYDTQAARQVERDEAVALDIEVGARVQAVYDTLKIVARPGLVTDRSHRAREILTFAFPKGARAYTAIAFNAQSSAVTRLVGLLEQPDVAPFLAQLGLADTITEMKALNVRFAEATKPGPEPVTPARLATSRLHALDAILEVVFTAMVITLADGTADFREPIVRPWVDIDRAVASENRAKHHRSAPDATTDAPIAPVPAPALLPVT